MFLSNAQPILKAVLKCSVNVRKKKTGNNAVKFPNV